MKRSSFLAGFLFFFFSVTGAWSGDKVYTMEDLVEKNSITYDKKTNEPVSGIFKGYYESGEVVIDIPYKDGKIDGLSKVYQLSGGLLLEISYNDGIRDGLEKKYHVSGFLLNERPYNNGTLDGIAKEYFESGEVNYEITFKNGKSVSGYVYTKTKSIQSGATEKRDQFTIYRCRRIITPINLLSHQQAIFSHPLLSILSPRYLDD